MKRNGTRHSSNANRKVDLGDDSTNISDDLALDLVSFEGSNSSTDYGLEFTNSTAGGTLISECRKQQTPQRRSSQRAQKKPNMEQIGIEAPCGALREPVQNIRQSMPSTIAESRFKSHVQSNSRHTVGHTLEPENNKKKKSRKQKNPIRKRDFWNELKYLQSHKDNIIPRLPFGRLVKEILLITASSATKITRIALEALQEASEMYLTQQLQDAYTLTLHRGRVTLSVLDMELLRYIHR